MLVVLLHIEVREGSSSIDVERVGRVHTYI